MIIRLIYRALRIISMVIIIFVIMIILSKFFLILSDIFHSFMNFIEKLLNGISKIGSNLKQSIFRKRQLCYKRFKKNNTSIQIYGLSSRMNSQIKTNIYFS